MLRSRLAFSCTVRLVRLSQTCRATSPVVHHLPLALTYARRLLKADDICAQLLDAWACGISSPSRLTCKPKHNMHTFYHPVIRTKSITGLPNLVPSALLIQSSAQLRIPNLAMPALAKPALALPVFVSVKQIHLLARLVFSLPTHVD